MTSAFFGTRLAKWSELGSRALTNASIFVRDVRSFRVIRFRTPVIPL
jgi:hypothetical protein